MSADTLIYFTIIGGCMWPGPIDKIIDIRIYPGSMYEQAAIARNLKDADAFVTGVGGKHTIPRIHLNGARPIGLCHELGHAMGWHKGIGHEDKR